MSSEEFSCGHVFHNKFVWYVAFFKWSFDQDKSPSWHSPIYILLIWWPFLDLGYLLVWFMGDRRRLDFWKNHKQTSTSCVSVATDLSYFLEIRKAFMSFSMSFSHPRLFNCKILAKLLRLVTCNNTCTQGSGNFIITFQGFLPIFHISGHGRVLLEAVN